MRSWSSWPGLLRPADRGVLVISERAAEPCENVLGKLGMASRTRRPCSPSERASPQPPRRPSPSGPSANGPFAPLPRVGSFDPRLHELIDVLSRSTRPVHDEGADLQETVAGDPRKAAKLKVLIVDDDARVGRALRRLIESSPDFAVVGEAGSPRAPAARPGTGSRSRRPRSPAAPGARWRADPRELRGPDRPVVAVRRLDELDPEAIVTGA